jgi:structural maintenance of chromosome 4
MKTILSDKTAELNKARSAQMELKAQIASEKAQLSSLANKAKQAESEMKNLELSLTGFEEMDEEMPPLEVYETEQLEGMDMKRLVSECEKLKNLFSGNSPNLSVLKEYRQKMQVYKERSASVEEAMKKRDDMKNEYDRLRKERLDTFMQGFTAISQKLKEMYQMITLGGNAELELVDSMDPFSEGVLFSVMPPKKSWKNISNLSGGEKTLSSLALVFALHHFKPTPLYVMDEIDAALDFRNVSIIANYIKQRTRNAQFVIISLRNNMFELADRLVGIYKV